MAMVNTRDDGGAANHAVAVIDYNPVSGVFKFWDAQNNCSGTFVKSDLRVLLISENPCDLTGNASGNTY